MTTSTEKSYFDLHITGLGYLNRIREVKPKKGDMRRSRFFGQSAKLRLTG